jgi:uncharacterized protein (TIGR00255 family)
MTGFGVGSASYREGRVVAEVRSVNHRFLDLRVRLPSDLGDQVSFIEQLVREHVERGRLDVTVQLEGAVGLGGIDLDRARRLYDDLCRLRDEIAPGAEVPIAALAAFSATLAPPSPHDVTAFRVSTAAAVDAALANLDAMRRREGARLADDIRTRVERVSSLTEAIASRIPHTLDDQLERLRERVSRLVQGAGLTPDPGRLETELALLADRGDVTEELVRVGSHIAQITDIIVAEGPHGKRLDFLLQELGREANTIGSKSQDAQVSHLAIDVKVELSRLREQIQNVE